MEDRTTEVELLPGCHTAGRPTDTQRLLSTRDRETLFLIRERSYKENASTLIGCSKISLPDQFKDGVRVPKSRDNVSLSTKESKIDLIMQDRIAAMLPNTLIG